MLAKIKNLVKGNFQDIFIILVIMFVALICFGLGRLTVPTKEPVLIKNLKEASVEDLKIEQSASVPLSGTTADKGRVVGSKNSDKYHLPECPGAKQISEQNKVWFDSIAEAKKAGYSPAANCPGLK